MPLSRATRGILRARAPTSRYPHTRHHPEAPASRRTPAPRARRGAPSRGHTPEGPPPACASCVSGSARSGRGPPGELSSPSSQNGYRGRTKASTLGVLPDDRISIAAVIPDAPGGDKLEMKKSQSRAELPRALTCPPSTWGSPAKSTPIALQLVGHGRCCTPQPGSRPSL